MKTITDISISPNFKRVAFLFPREKFVPIPHYSGKYSISNYGRVRSEKRLKWNGVKFIQINARIIGWIKQHNHKQGNDYYFIVRLWRDNIGTKFYVHRLVAGSFLSGPPKPTINHIDGNKRNNHSNNLEWSTYSENNQHAINNNLTSRRRGSQVKSSKLNESQIIEIRTMSKNGLSNRAIAKEFKVDHKTIDRIISKKGWCHVN